MFIKKHIISMFAGLVLFSGCAPQPLGSRGNPSILQPNGIVTVYIGEKNFFKMAGPIGLIDRSIRDAAFANNFKDISQISPGQSATVTGSWLEITNVKPSDDINLEMVSQEAKREVGQTGTSNDGRFIQFTLIDTLSMIISVETLATRASGFQNMTFNVGLRGNPTRFLTYPIRLEFIQRPKN
ncbi:MAG: hypothetical protein RLZZ156_2651 [Deinococcota bacterium]|jgi:hypothetical protein